MANRVILRGARALTGQHLSLSDTELDLEIEDGVIVSIRPAADDGDAIDLRGRLLVPGLINGHFHSHEHFHKGRVENLPLELWMHYVRAPLAVGLTPRQVYLRTMIGAIEALRSGTTTVVDDLLPGPSINRENLEAASWTISCSRSASIPFGTSATRRSSKAYSKRRGWAHKRPAGCGRKHCHELRQSFS